MKGTHTLNKTDDDDWIIVHTGEGPGDPPCELDELPTLGAFIAELAPGQYDITGIRDGVPVIGNIVIELDERGDGGDGLPLALRPVLEDVPLLGGPLDGMKVRATEPTHDLERLTMVDNAGNLSSDELYLARVVEGELWGVHAEMLQDYVRSDEVHLTDPAEVWERKMRAQADVPDEQKLRAAIPVCAKGEHDWTDWQRTPRGNKTRMCRRCLSGQSSLLS